MKIFRRISLILALACAVMCFSLFATACGDDKDKNASTYTVKLVYEDGTAVNGTELNIPVQVCFVDAAGVTGNCFIPKKPDASGTVSWTAEETTALKTGEKLHVKIPSLDQTDTQNYNAELGYTYDAEADSAYFTAPGTTTITIKKA